MNAGAPDVCLTPPGVPVPYPNFALHCQAVPFSPLVRVNMVNALNMMSKIPMTFGDNAGVLHPVFMQFGAFTMGNPLVFVERIPAINLLCPTTGNAMNNPIGAVVVPGSPNVFYTLAGIGGGASEGGSGVSAGATAEDLADLSAILSGKTREPQVSSSILEGGVGWLRIRAFTADITTRVYNEIRALERAGLRALVIDLLGCPGGEMDAWIKLAADFLPDGALIVKVTDADGDETEHRARGAASYTLPVAVLVDRRTASAAELFAGCLQANGRALVIGETTFGKGVALTIVPGAEGGAEHAVVATCTLKGNRVVHGAGVTPDVALDRSALSGAGLERDQAEIIAALGAYL
jgi:carboxyl-terminal processing protease